MNTFRNKQFKNELDPKYAFYNCHHSCELNNSSEESLEECVETCELKKSSKEPITKNKNLKFNFERGQEFDLSDSFKPLSPESS